MPTSRLLRSLFVSLCLFSVNPGCSQQTGEPRDAAAGADTPVSGRSASSTGALESSESPTTDPHAAYYASVDVSNPTALRASLHALIDDHRRASYSQCWQILKKADEDPLSPSHILDLYGNNSYVKVAGGNGPYNREHTWPKSYGFPNDNARNYPYTDCHHLFLCNNGYNSSRGNKPFDSCATSCSEKPTVANGGQGGPGTGYPGNSNWTTGSGNSGRFEVWIGRRGDVARAMFYMDVRYEGGVHGNTAAAEPDLVLTDNMPAIRTGSGNVAHMGRLSTLLEWHNQDPVDDKERARNDAVFEFQGNRNPFIDHPEWVDCVFKEECD